MYLLDTNHVVCFQYGNSPEYLRLKSRLENVPENKIFVCVVSFHESILGWNKYLAKSRDSYSLVKAYSRFEGILRDFSNMQLLSFDERAAVVFDELLQSTNKRVGTMDLRIASIAIANQMTLLTQNTVDFERIPNLILDDWMA